MADSGINKNIVIALLIVLLLTNIIRAEYTIIDLGTLGGSESRGRDINSSGQVVGHSYISGTYPEHGFIWSENGGMIDLETLSAPYNAESWAYGMNDIGQVVGASGDRATTQQHAFVWDSVKGMIDIGTLGGPQSIAYDINTAGKVVGHSRPTGLNKAHAFLWQDKNDNWQSDDGEMIDMGTLGGDQSRAYAINEVDQVAGTSKTSNNLSHAFIWEDTNANGISDPGEMQDLGTLGGNQSDAGGMNDDGVVVGASSLPGDSTTNPFLWKPGYGMEDLGNLGGSYSAATGINSFEQVVGISYTAVNSPRAFIWDSTNGIRDLNTLLPANSSWELHMAYRINDAGQITGWGEINGEIHSFLMSPANQPPIADAGEDQTVEQDSPAGASVTLDGSDSSDPDDDPLEYTWMEGETLLGTGEILLVTLTPGIHTITLTVDDGNGGIDDDEVVITINVEDRVVVYLQDNEGYALADQDIKVRPAYGGSWGPTYSGTTNADGALAIEDMKEGYTKIKMTLNQGSVEQTVAELNASNYTWTAVPLTIAFLDDMGFGLVDGKVDQGGGTWVHHGYTDEDGQLTVHVFPEKQYKFRVGYNYTSLTKWFEVPGPGAHTEEFQTELATVTVLDFEEYALAGVKVDQGGGSWVHHGYTDENGELSLQLFGDKDYKFRVGGDVVNNSRETDWFAVPGSIVFQTGYVVSEGTAIKAAIGGRWITYSPPGMDLLPGTYKFIFSAPTPSPQWITVNAGEIVYID